MPAPLLPMLAGAIGRLVTANVGRGIAGAIGRSAVATGGRAAAASAAPGEASSAWQFVTRYAKQRSRRRLARAKNRFLKNAPGFAQRHHWQRVNKAFGQLQNARSAKQAALQLGDPLKVQQAEEQEERAKAKLAKETKALLDSFSSLKRGVIGVIVALHTLPHAIQAIGRAQVENIRSRSGMYAGQTAGALVRYDVNERLNKISSARATEASDTRVIEATKELNNQMKPLTEAMHILYSEGLVVLIRATSGLVSIMRTFSPLVQSVEKLAQLLGGDRKADSDVTVEMMRGLTGEAQRQMERAQRDWNRNRRPPAPGGGL